MTPAPIVDGTINATSGTTGTQPTTVTDANTVIGTNIAGTGNSDFTQALTSAFTEANKDPKAAEALNLIQQAAGAENQTALIGALPFLLPELAATFGSATALAASPLGQNLLRLAQDPSTRDRIIGVLVSFGVNTVLFSALWTTTNEPGTPQADVAARRLADLPDVTTVNIDRKSVV